MSLRQLFYPKSVAVVGASRVPGKIGREVVRNIIIAGFPGRIYPINPSAEEILGLKAYPSLLDVPEPIDLAVIAVPARIVPKVVREAGEKGVKVVVIISSGFSEVGNVKLEDEVLKIAREYGVRVLGPNVFGIVYTPTSLNASFGPPTVLPGKIALISQSGALGVALMSWTTVEEIGLSAVVSLGNKSDIDDSDLLEFFLEDYNTSVITIYMEGLKPNSGKRFLEVASRVSIKKPVIVLKAGRSEEGAAAAASHTGSLAGVDVVYDYAFRQAGILRAKNIEEMFDWARAFASQPVPKREGTLIITNGGGVGVMATDEASEKGLKLLRVHRGLEEELRKYMPPFGSTRNPIDLTGQASANDYYGALKAALKDEKVGSVLILYCRTAVLNPIDVVKAIEDAIDEVRGYAEPKPVLTSLIGGEDVMIATKELNKRDVPTYPIPERAVSALSAMVKWGLRVGITKPT